MKHSAKLKGCAFKLFPRMAVCEEVLYLEMYDADERSGLEHSVGRWLRTISEFFPEEKVFSKKSSCDLSKPVVNADVAEVGHVDRDYGRERHILTKKLLMTEFEKNEEVVWTAKNRARMHVWLGCLALLLIVDDSSKLRTGILETSGCFRFKGSGCKVRPWHIDMKYWHDKFPRHFMIANGTEKRKF